MNALIHHEHRRGWRLAEWGWLLVGAVLMVVVSAAPSWHNIFVEHWPDSWLLVIGSVVAMTISAAAVEWLSRMPLIRSRKLSAVIIGMAFVILAAVLMITRSYYSRGFLLIAPSFSLVWIMLGHWLRVWIASPLRWGLVESGCVDPLRNVSGIQWTSINQPGSGLPAVGAIVADTLSEVSPEWRRFLTKCRFHNIPVLDAGVVYEALTGRIQPEWVNEGHLIGVRTARSMSVIKRTFDLCICLLLSPLLLLLTGICVVAIKLDSPGPVFYRQDRVGLDNHTFRVCKLRTMVMEREGNAVSFADEHDGRITRVGRILRKCRLDEIPQFWNVIKGEMSVVGPRPEQREFVDQFLESIPFYDLRHLVRPGITGWAQVHYGYAADEIENRRKLEFDLFYLKHWSFMLDTMILMRTVVVVLTGQGAR
jgi:lipopolysaccharide/colanic/teichoic acid biosynthesis glycosyltransferase